MKYIERETPRESETITSKYIDNKTDECGRQTETNIGTNIETKKVQWWWSSGQRARLLLRRSEFESC